MVPSKLPQARNNFIPLAKDGVELISSNLTMPSYEARNIVAVYNNNIYEFTSMNSYQYLAFAARDASNHPTNQLVWITRLAQTIVMSTGTRCTFTNIKIKAFDSCARSKSAVKRKDIYVSF